MPTMLALIFVLTLAIRSIALVIGAVASVEKAAVDGRLKAVSCSGVAFPCHFPTRHLAGKIFSLLARLGKLAQRLDLTGEYPAERADFGAETKSFPAFSRVAGKFASWARMRPIPKIPSTGSPILPSAAIPTGYSRSRSSPTPTRSRRRPRCGVARKWGCVAATSLSSG